MSKPKAILFDADGVLTLPEEMFSAVYAKSRGLDLEPFEDFFKNDWAEIVTGRKDLKDSIHENPDLWQWPGTAAELLEYWFKTEDVRNEELLTFVQRLRAEGTPCYLATEQEAHRSEYMKNVMFKDLFDGYFVTADIGIKKSNPDFFRAVLTSLMTDIDNLQPSDVVFFDDSQSKIDAAVTTGIRAHLYTGIDVVHKALA